MKRASGIVVGVALWASLAVAAEADYVVAARSDVRVRSAVPGDRSTVAAAEVELLPDGEAGLRWKTYRFALQYNPSLIIRDRVDLSPFIFLHRGRATLTANFERANLSLVQEASFGETDVGALRAADGAPPGSAPTVQTVGAVPYVRSATTAVVDVRLTEVLGLSVSGGYLLSGSRGNDALPFQWGPTATARLRWAVSRLDALTTIAQATASWFSPRVGRREGQQQLVSFITEQWDRQLTRTLTTSLGAGLAFTRDYVPPLDPPQFDANGDPLPPGVGEPIPGLYREVLPVVSATLGWHEEAHTNLLFSTRMAPFADRFTGLVYERIETRAQGEFRLDRPLVFTAATGFAIAVPVGQTQQAGDRVIYGEVTGGWTPKEWFLLGFSARALWTEQPRLGVPGQLQWLTSVWVSVRDHDVTAW
jgi:hypothetical protein